ncbi:MAG: Matrixin family metalloprotease [Thermoproteota archaeon]|nr:Matrixin family metalloprotease [Thermoproteota archaeon]
MVFGIKRKSLCCILFLAVISMSVSLNITFVEAATASYLIDLEDFRWNKFSLKVLVDMNEWSTYNYATAVHGALDSWVKGIWNYTRTYNNMTPTFNFLFYVSNVNSTGSYDIIISFSQNEFSQNAVGLTSYRWESKSHLPITPIMINITTYSVTADNLFIKNVAMHELGHALGLGHAYSQDTTNGPELMYSTSTMKEAVYPSTLDVYGLTMLYNGLFSQTIQLPLKVPYVMLAEGNIPSQDQTFPKDILYLITNKLEVFFTNPQEALYQPIILLVPSMLLMIIALIFGLLLRSGSKATLASITILIFANYIALIGSNLTSLGLIIILLSPSILIGASIGGFISYKITRRSIDS